MKVISILLLSLILATSLFAESGALDDNLIKKFEDKFNQNPDNKLKSNAISNNTIKNLSLDQTKLTGHDPYYSLNLKSTGIVNQKSSGRCWIFAGVNTMSPNVRNKLDLSDFEISEPFLTFYDKLEKANFFLERVIELRDKPLDDRSLSLEKEYMFGDGGWWQYFVNLMQKYGVVPIQAMPETKQTVKSGAYNNLGKTLLRADMMELRKMNEEGKSVKELRARKEEMMADIYQLLVYTVGKPPTEFTWRYEYKDKEDTTKKEKEIVEVTYTPKEFYNEFFGDGLSNFVAISNVPSKDYNKLYQLENSRNIYEAPDIQLLNLPIEKLKKYTKQTLLDSQMVWFACDVGKDNFNDSGIFKAGIYDYNTTFGIDFNMSKKEKLLSGDISPNHAMTITGVDTTKDGQPLKWKIENSWGKRGDDGFWHMYDDWYDEYLLLVIIDKKYLDMEDLRLFESKPTLIKDWEPFFSEFKHLKIK